MSPRRYADDVVTAATDIDYYLLLSPMPLLRLMDYSLFDVVIAGYQDIR